MRTPTWVRGSVTMVEVELEASVAEVVSGVGVERAADAAERADA